MVNDVSTRPTEAEILAWFRTLSNWGRWGPDDELGTLNLFTAERREQAARLISEGVAVSCARTISYEFESDTIIRPDLARHLSPGIAEAIAPPQHFMNAVGDIPTGRYGRFATVDTFLIGIHGMTITHLDAPAHSVWRSGPDEAATLYNDRPAADSVTMQGASIGSIELAGDGIAGRAVLLDIASIQGVEWLEPGTAITPTELAAAEKQQRIRVGSGDILFIRTGHPGRRRKLGPVDPPTTWSGLQAACLPWLRERDVALLSCDTPNDVGPVQYPEIGHAIHGIGMVSMGLWLLDNGDFEELAALCRRLGRWEFFLVIAPLKLYQATGSPVNPIAIL